LSVLQLLGIAIGVAAAVGMTLASRSALQSLGDAVDFLRGGATHTIERPAGPMEEKVLAGLLADPAVKFFAPVIDRKLRLEGGEQVRLLGVDPFLDKEVRSITAPPGTAMCGKRSSPPFSSIPGPFSLMRTSQRTCGYPRAAPFRHRKDPCGWSTSFPIPPGSP
jgi:hypothetical protein